MTATPNSAKKRRRGRKKVNSAHVAAPGQREQVARPVQRVEEPVPTPAPRRHRGRIRASRQSRNEAAGTMTLRHGDQLDRVFSARLVSGVMLFFLLIVLFLLFQSDAFYVRSIEVGGINYLTAEEVFTLSEAANVHLFWLDTDTIQQNVLRSPSVAEADVGVGWPPHLVQIEIRERDPALIWEQAGVRTWIDVRGRVMQQRSDLQDMLRIVVEGVDSPVGPNVVIPQDVVDGALQLHTLYPALDVLLYTPVEGLGFQDGRGWRVWYGTGANMVARDTVYRTIVADLQARGVQPEFVDVGDIDAPYYKVWWRQGEADSIFGTGEPATPPAEN